MSRSLVRCVASNARNDGYLSNGMVWVRSPAIVRTSQIIPSRTLSTLDPVRNEDTIDHDAQREPWKILLEMPARAAWRVTDPRLPDKIQTQLRHILDQGGRSPKRLKQIYAEIIEAHKKLLKRREKERFRVVTGKKPTLGDTKRDNNVLPIFYGPDEALASFKYRFFPNYAIAKRVFEECKSLLGPKTWKPTRALDFGIGIGSASVACLDVWEGIEWVHGIDPSETMRDGAKKMLDGFVQARRDGGEEISTRITLSAHLSLESSSKFDIAVMSYAATELADSGSIMAAAAMLWEKLEHGGIFVMIEPGTPDGFSSVRTIRNMLLDCCGTDGAQDECHIIAPCTHSGPCPMERFQKLRNMKKTQMDQPIVEEEKYEANDGDTDDDVVSSDEDEDTDLEEDDRDEHEDEHQDDEDVDEVDSDEEGSEQNDGIRAGFCSFVQTMPTNQGRHGKEKFSYLVAQKRITGQAHDFGDLLSDASLENLLNHSMGSRGENYEESLFQENLKRAKQLATRFLLSDEDDLGLELLRSDDKRKYFTRIIHAPKKRRGHILIDCCAAPGQIITHKVAKSHSKSAPGIFAAARKSRWGGLWPDVRETGR